MVAWAAAFTPTAPGTLLSLQNLKVAFFMLVASIPLFIAFVGPMLSKITRETLPFWLLLIGLIMFVSSLVLAGTKYGLVIAFGLGATATAAIVLFVGVAGFGLMLWALAMSTAKMAGRSMSPW